MISSQFVHDGIMYAVGDPVPDNLIDADIERLIAARHLAPVADDGSIIEPAAVAPASVEAYLMTSDTGVLRLIRTHAPNKRLVRAILEMAEVNGRHAVLLEALRLHLEIPV